MNRHRLTAQPSASDAPGPGRRASHRLPVLAIAYGLLVLVVVGLFGRSITGGERPAFRDVGYFYTPLYGYLAERERQQWLPLFNPLDIAGMPIAGETTTALFYPPRRIIFSLVQSPAAAPAVYVALHLLLAGCCVHYACRAAGASSRASAIAVVAYPLSGPIFFLYCNPPFLVGAAWLPLAVAAGARLLRRHSARDVTLGAIALAMPVLGGDPQTSIHVLLIGAAAWMVSAGRRPAGCFRRLGSLALAASATVVLAAPQIAASVDWGLQSARYLPTAPAGGGSIYAFSVAPWHWVELAAPAVSGPLFPIYGRLSHLIPGDGATWTITLYCGLLPFSLAVSRYLHVSPRRWDLWEALPPIGLFFALGSFGVGYLINRLPWPATSWEDAAGGGYWSLVHLVPGYEGFRYPAKWLVFVPLGVSVLAARRASRLTPADRLQIARVVLSVAAIGLVISAAVAAAVSLSAVLRPAALQASDPFWGPLQWETALAGLGISSMTVTLIAAAAFTAMRRQLSRVSLCGAIVLLSAIDLTLAARPTLATVPPDRFPPGIADSGFEGHADEAGRNASRGFGPRPWPLRAMRFAPHGPWPGRWSVTPSPGRERLMEVEATLQHTRHGRWHLAERVNVFNSTTSLPPGRVRAFWQAANGAARELHGEDQQRYWDAVLHWLAIDERWTLRHTPAPASDGFLPTRLDVAEVTPAARPVTWSATARSISPARWVSPEAFAQRIDEVVADSPVPPIIESDEQRSAAQPPASVDEPTRLRFRSPTPERVEVSLETAAPGLIVLKQFQDGNWRASLRRPAEQTGASRVLPVHRCDYLFMAVEVPAGRSELIVEYRPWWLMPALVIAATGWLAAMVRLGIGSREEKGRVKGEG